MNIKLLVGEGKNDVIFAEAMAKFHFSLDVSEFYVISPRNTHKESFKILQRKIGNPREVQFFRNKLIIFGDNGKSNLINKLIPRIAKDFVTKHGIYLLSIVDQGDQNPREIFNNLISKIKNQVSNMEAVTLKTNDAISIESSIRPQDFFVKCKLIVIPKSLEYQIAERAKTKFKMSSIRNVRDPHVTLEILAEKNNLTVEDIIRKSVQENWFGNEIWFKGIKDEIKNFL